MSGIFNTFFYQPLFNLLVAIYNFLPNHDIGISIILLTVLIRVILSPLSKSSLKSQKAMQGLQPKMDEVKKKYANQKEKQAQALMELYKQEKVNPLSSCLPLIIQLPFLLAIYRVFINGFKVTSLSILYSFVHNPGAINPSFLGLLNLSVPNTILALLAALAQFWQTKMLVRKKPAIKSEGSKDENMMAIMNQQMTYLFPVLTFIIGLKLPSGLMVYWLTTTLLTVLQQKYYFRTPSTSLENPKNS